MGSRKQEQPAGAAGLGLSPLVLGAQEWRCEVTPEQNPLYFVQCLTLRIQTALNWGSGPSKARTEVEPGQRW